MAGLPQDVDLAAPVPDDELAQGRRAHRQPLPVLGEAERGQRGPRGREGVERREGRELAEVKGARREARGEEAGPGVEGGAGDPGPAALVEVVLRSEAPHAAREAVAVRERRAGSGLRRS